jgi:hypothetical protein
MSVYSLMPALPDFRGACAFLSWVLPSWLTRGQTLE